jgi:L-threonylcarbamoyladenylate synthase
MPSGLFCKVETWRSNKDEGGLVQAGARLFRILRAMDSSDLDEIIAEAVPEVGIGVAIMDRLKRAAAAKPEADSC